ncbi:MAG: site-specific integrase [Candidatus Bathyarchaeota archaeon]|nr:site-specific integrase [Candidatus Bathyarchaeota archaeon]MDH5786706.1 site-specific integrase [Candidatus Bathyarchaeota archaeon]
MDYVTSAQKKHAGSYIHNTTKVVKSWLAHNGIQLKRKIKITGAHETPTLKDERVPTKEELKRIFLSGSKQARTACAIVAHAGLRLQGLGSYTGYDGLRMRDLPELKIKGSEVSFEKIPTMVVVRSALSKARHQYFTFLAEEACSYLKDYLEERLRDGEQLTPDSAIVKPKVAQKPFIRTVNIGDMMRLAIRSAGLPWRPYVLRCYFDTMLMLAESKGLMLRDYRQFWMGHKGDIENRYTTNKQRLPESVIEDMRAAYERSQEFLQTKEKEETSEEKLRDSFRKQLLLVAGFNQEEVDKMDLPSMSDEELQSLVKKKLLGAPTSDSSKQKVVSIDEANGYLAKGWEYVAKLSNNKVVIKMNSLSP